MELLECEVVAGLSLEGCWDLYHRAFEGLRSQAVQRHLMYRDEFDDVMADKRVAKLVVTDRSGGVERLAAVATFTNHLDAVPLVSPEYFRARWPELYDAGLIWYVGFLAIDPDYWRTSASALLVRTICSAPAASGGIVGVDICEFNESTQRMSTGLLRLGRAVSTETTLHRLDAQVFWAYEFPRPDDA
ncbi:MAG: hypothetical protein ACKVZ6_17540 [Kineosporiaceae bacterium]|jgi:hypothetical protein